MTYRMMLNNLRAATDLPPYEGEPFPCTGSAHLAGVAWRCTNPIHVTQDPLIKAGLPASAVRPLN